MNNDMFATSATAGMPFGEAFGATPDFKAGQNQGFDFEAGKAGENKTADTLSKIVNTFTTQVATAKKKKDFGLLEKLRVFGLKLFDTLIDLSKKAFEMAMNKFAIELCAMIIAAIGAAWTGKGNQAFDISTRGVFYHANGQTMQAANPAPQQQSFSNNQNPFGDPFSSWNNSGRSSVSSF